MKISHRSLSVGLLAVTLLNLSPLQGYASNGDLVITAPTSGSTIVPPSQTTVLGNVAPGRVANRQNQQGTEWTYTSIIGTVLVQEHLYVAGTDTTYDLSSSAVAPTYGGPPGSTTGAFSASINITQTQNYTSSNGAQYYITGQGYDPNNNTVAGYQDFVDINVQSPPN